MPPEADNLDGLVAVVTGAGRGIGRAISIGYARAGAAVCCGARTESEIAQTVADIRGFSGKAEAKVADVSRQRDMEELCAFARERFGGIDIVVANAGISLHASVETSDPAAWQDVLETNLHGAYFTARAAIPHLKDRGGGKIIFVGSGLGHRGAVDTSAYACSKAGVWMLTRVLAQELVRHKISVNELIPGPVRTGINLQDDDELRAQLGAHEWIKQPEDVVPLALFLAAQPESGPTAQSFSLKRGQV